MITEIKYRSNIVLETQFKNFLEKSYSKIFILLYFDPFRPVSGQKERHNLIFFFFFFSHLYVVPQKVFMKALKAFLKPFEVPKRSVKIKI